MKASQRAERNSLRKFKRHFVPFNAAELRSRLPLSLFRAPRMRDSTASVDDLRFKRHEVPFNASAVRFKDRAMQSDRVAVKATSRSSFSGKLRKRHSRAQEAKDCSIGY